MRVRECSSSFIVFVSSASPAHLRPHSRFLKAKVTILQQELDLSHQENAKHLDKIAKAAEQQKKLDGARCQASTTINSLNSQIKKQQQNEANAALKLKVGSPPTE